MAKLDARTEDFIRILLDVSGRARPADLHGVSEADAAALLQDYAAAHPERPLSFSDGVLSVGSVPDAPVEEPVYDVTGSVQAAPPSHEMWAAPQQDAMDEAPAAPAWTYETPPPAPQADPVQHEYADFEVAPGPVAPEPAAIPVEESQPAAWDGGPQPLPDAGDWQGSAEPNAEDLRTSLLVEEPPVDWYWWLAPFFFTWLGGLVAWLVLRQRQPRGARRLLIFGFIMTAVVVLIGILGLVFGLGAIMTLSA